MAASHYYKPPKSYWKEVCQLDARLRDASEPDAGIPQGRPRNRDRRSAAWQGEQGTLCVWRTAARSISRLVIATLVNVDPLSEGLPAENSYIRTGLLGKGYDYYTGRVLPKFLFVDHLQTPDISQGIQQPPEDFRTLRMEARTGTLVADAEDHDIMLSELRRGASGDCRIEEPSHSRP